MALSKKYLDFDDFDCFDDGEYITNSPENASILLKNFNNESLKNRKILVCFSAAVSNRDKKTGPFYSGLSLSDNTNMPLVSVADYLVTNNKNLSLAWYCGCEKYIDFPNKIANFLDKIAKFYNCELIFLGGSGGGFASLVIASKIQSKVFVIASNPQTSICNYIAKHVENYIKVAFASEKDHGYINSKNILKKYNLTYDINNIFYKENVKILYIINFDDEHHIKEHLSNFIKNKDVVKFKKSENIYKINENGLFFGDFGIGYAGPGINFFKLIIDDICLNKSVDDILIHLENGLSGTYSNKSNKVALIHEEEGCKKNKYFII